MLVVNASHLSRGGSSMLARSWIRSRTGREGWWVGLYSPE